LLEKQKAVECCSDRGREKYLHLGEIFGDKDSDIQEFDSGMPASNQCFYYGLIRKLDDNSTLGGRHP
jgi:hypothetical protein